MIHERKPTYALVSSAIVLFVIILNGCQIIDFVTSERVTNEEKGFAFTVPNNYRLNETDEKRSCELAPELAMRMNQNLLIDSCESYGFGFAGDLDSELLFVEVSTISAETELSSTEIINMAQRAILEIDQYPTKELATQADNVIAFSRTNISEGSFMSEFYESQYVIRVVQLDDIDLLIIATTLTTTSMDSEIDDRLLNVANSLKSTD